MEDHKVDSSRINFTVLNWKKSTLKMYVFTLGSFRQFEMDKKSRKCKCPLVLVT